MLHYGASDLSFSQYSTQTASERFGILHVECEWTYAWLVGAQQRQHFQLTQNLAQTAKMQKNKNWHRLTPKLG